MTPEKEREREREREEREREREERERETEKKIDSSVAINACNATSILRLQILGRHVLSQVSLWYYTFRQIWQ